MGEERISGLVSIVVPILNAAQFLDETIRSVLAQSYDKWELLLIDDGSTDESPAIAQRYGVANPSRVHCLHHPEQKNVGVCTTRNLGIACSRGEFVAFLDADDVWLPEKLEQQVAAMQASPRAGMLYGRSIYFDHGAEQSTQHIPSTAPGGKVYEPPELLKLNYPLGAAGAPCPSSLLVRAEVLQQVGGFEESFNRPQAFEDQAFLAKIYLNVPVLVSETVWDKYRCHATSYWHRALREGDVDRAFPAYLQWLSDYLRQRQIADPEIWQSIARLTWPYRHPLLARMRRVARGTAKRVIGRHRND